MPHVKRVLCVLILVAVAVAPAVRGDGTVKPRVRAITGFITIDAKSYASQIQEAVTFLSHYATPSRRPVTTSPGFGSPRNRSRRYTRDLNRTDAVAVLHGINDLATTLRFAPNVGPAMVKDTDDTASVDLITDVLSEPGNRLNANIIVASEDGIHWQAVRQAARVIKAVGERSPHGQGNFNFGATAMLKPLGPFYPGAWHPGGGPRSFAIGLEAANVVMDVFAREHDPRTAAKTLSDALTVHLHAVETAAMKAAAGSEWTYAGIDPTPAPGGQSSIGAAIESFIGAPFGSPGTETAAGIITRAVKDVAVKQTGYSGLMIPVSRDNAHAPLDRGNLRPRLDPRLFGRVRGRCRYRSAAWRHERSRDCEHRRRCGDARVQMEQTTCGQIAAGSRQEGWRDDRVQRRTRQRDHPAAAGFVATVGIVVLCLPGSRLLHHLRALALITMR